MFKEKVNARTDGHTTDNGPWHKLAGLRPVELKTSTHLKLFQTHMIRSATLILPTSRLQFYFNFESYNEMWSFNSVIFI